MLGTILIGTQIASGLLSEHEQSSISREAAKEKYYATMNAVHSLEKQKALLGSIYENLRKPVVDRYGNALLKTNITESNLYKKSNMAYSGTVEQAVGLERSDIKSRFSSELMNLELRQASEEGAIASKIEELKGQAAAYKKQSKYYTPTERFFKSIGDLF